MKSMVGKGIVRLNAFLTVAFVVTAILATVLFEQPWTQIAAGVALGCFCVGVVVFLWGYWSAVQRSRADNIAVAALYFLIDKCAPRSVAVIMNSLLGVQVVVSIATASIRSSTQGSQGSTLAYGILVPMMGLGLNGLWAAFHGTFRPRRDTKIEGVPDKSPASGQDVNHE